MDSLPQELIDTIIDNLSLSSLLSCSLVAKKWRRRSQQRAFDIISFSSEGEVNRWCTDIPQDPDGISSYVRFASFYNIHSWDEPALFGRVLKNLTLLEVLWVFETRVPDELQGPISRGEFGREIAILELASSYCALTTMLSLILSLSKLEGLIIGNHEITSEGPLPTHPVTPQRGPLDILWLGGDVGGVGEALAQSRFISSNLYLDTHIAGIEQLIVLSSDTLVDLKLSSRRFDHPERQLGAKRDIGQFVLNRSRFPTRALSRVFFTS